MTDRTYENLRNALIPEAMQAADIVAGPRPQYNKTKTQEAVCAAWVDKWNRMYHQTMDELARKHGLTN